MRRDLRVLALLAGCGHPSSPDTGDPLLTFPFEVSAKPVDAIPTVLRVTWTADLADVTASWVEFGTDTTYGQDAPTDLSDPTHTTLLLGSAPGTEVHLRVRAETPDGRYASDDVAVTTGPAPASLPNLVVEEPGGRRGFEGLVTSLVAYPAAVILDPLGNYVWWHEAEQTAYGGTIPGGAGVVLGRTRLSQDGREILYSYTNVEAEEDNAVTHVSLDGTLRGETPIPYGHHDFVDLEDGTIAYLAYDPRTLDGEEVLGDALREVTPDGTLREVWNAWDHYTYTGFEGPDPGYGWPHANAIDWMPDENLYLVSFYALTAILAIDRDTGETRWTAGGAQSDYSWNGSTALFTAQHQFQWADGRLLVFINSGFGAQNQAHVVEYALDHAAGTATETWRYEPAEPINCVNLGDVEQLGNGDVLVTFSTAGSIQEIDADGVVQWQLLADIGGALGYLTPEGDLNGRRD